MTSDSLALKDNGMTSQIPPEGAAVSGTCNCEYQILVADVPNPPPVTGTLEHYLAGGPLSCSECGYFTGWFGQCSNLGECADIITSYPTPFFPFQCSVPANSSFNIGWGAWWVEPGCPPFTYLDNGYITFRLRCQDAESSPGCQGYGYYSNEITINIGEKPPFGNFVNASLGRGSECGCEPTLTIVQ
jgi:hypothetical protein